MREHGRATTPLPASVFARQTRPYFRERPRDAKGAATPAKLGGATSSRSSESRHGRIMRIAAGPSHCQVARAPLPDQRSRLPRLRSPFGVSAWRRGRFSYLRANEWTRRTQFMMNTGSQPGVSEDADLIFGSSACSNFYIRMAIRRRPGHHAPAREGAFEAAARQCGREAVRVDPGRGLRFRAVTAQVLCGRREGRSVAGLRCGASDEAPHEEPPAGPRHRDVAARRERPRRHRLPLVGAEAVGERVATTPDDRVFPPGPPGPLRGLASRPAFASGSLRGCS